MGLRCLNTSIFIETTSLERLPTNAKEDPSPHKMRLSSAGHQPSISWSRGISLLLLLLLSLLLLLLLLLLLGLMLFPGKKCHNGRNQLVVLGTVASFFFYFFPHFISKTFCIILTFPSKQGFCNASIVKAKSNCSIHFLKCVVTLCNVSITTGRTSTFLTLKFFAMSYLNSL